MPSNNRELELEMEKKFYDQNQPFFPFGFSVDYRNPGHWDIIAKQCPGKASAWRATYPNGQTSAYDGALERAFRIRGEPGNVIVYDERWNPHKPFPRESIKFATVHAAMIYITYELMKEPSS